MNAKLARLVALGASAVTSALALAAPPDVTGVVTEIAATAAPIAAIGAAVLLVFVGIKTFKWVRRAM
jgi:putative flippase GtrA